MKLNTISGTLTTIDSITAGIFDTEATPIIIFELVIIARD